MATQYAVLPQSVASISNLVQSVAQWLYARVKVPFDALSIPGTIYDPSKNLWIADSGGLGLLEGESEDQSLWERTPTIGYCVGDGRQTKSPKITGCGDGAQWEWHACTITGYPPIRLSTDGSAELDNLSADTLKTLCWNATGRTFAIPFVDRGLSTNSDGTYQSISTARVESARFVKLRSAQDETVLARRNRFEIEFELRICAATTDGI